MGTDTSAAAFCVHVLQRNWSYRRWMVFISIGPYFVCSTYQKPKNLTSNRSELDISVSLSTKIKQARDKYIQLNVNIGGNNNKENLAAFYITSSMYSISIQQCFSIIGIWLTLLSVLFTVLVPKECSLVLAAPSACLYAPGSVQTGGEPLSGNRSLWMGPDLQKEGEYITQSSVCLYSHRTFKHKSDKHN